MISSGPSELPDPTSSPGQGEADPPKSSSRRRVCTYIRARFWSAVGLRLHRMANRCLNRAATLFERIGL